MSTHEPYDDPIYDEPPAPMSAPDAVEAAIAAALRECDEPAATVGAIRQYVLAALDAGNVPGYGRLADEREVTKGPFRVEGCTIYASDGVYFLEAPNIASMSSTRGAEQRDIDIQWVCDALNAAAIRARKDAK